MLFVLGKRASVNIVTSTDLTYLWIWHPVLPIDTWAWKSKLLKQGLQVCLRNYLWVNRFFFIVWCNHFFVGNSWLNCQIIESIFDMSVVYLHTLVQRCHSWRFISQIFAASNFAISNFRLVTSEICYFEFCYRIFLRKIMIFSLRTPRNIFGKFNNYSWKIRENKERISTNFICITFARYCRWFQLFKLPKTRDFIVISRYVYLFTNFSIQYFKRFPCKGILRKK